MIRTPRTAVALLAAAGLVCLAGCGGASHAKTAHVMGAAPALDAEPPPPPEGVPAGANLARADGTNNALAGAQPTGGTALKATKKPLLIYIGTLHLAVFEAVKSIDIVEKMARDRNGYLVKRTDTMITVRVPAEIFHVTVEDLAKLGDVTHRDITAQDVTAEFRDLEIRLQNLDVVRKRLSKLLDGAKNVKEALAVERELERVTTQMEQLKGRLKLLGELVAFSTINVHFQARPAEKVDSKVELPFPWLRDLGLPRLLRL